MSCPVTTELVLVRPQDCVVSAFAPRKTAFPAHVEALAKLIDAHGFDERRCLGALKAEDGRFEVFWGTVRLAAALELARTPERFTRKLETIPVLVHHGADVDEMARRATLDDAKDAVHREVALFDWCRHLHLLHHTHNWTLARIADVYQQKQVSRRIRIHELPEQLKLLANPELRGDPRPAKGYPGLEEAHLHLLVDLDCPNLFPWLDEETAKLKFAKAMHAKTEPVAAARLRFRDFKHAISLAVAHIDQRPEFRAPYLEALASSNAILPGEVEEAWVSLLAGSAVGDASDGVAARTILPELEAAKARVLQGPSEDMGRQFPAGIRLCLTDPPYGVAARSARSDIDTSVENDGDVEKAIGVFKAAMAPVVERLAKDAWVIVFTSWRTEHRFREALEADLGLELRGSGIWVKSGHGSGATDRDFAPKHERFLIAVKGQPRLTPGELRPNDVIYAPQDRWATHLARKPRRLLERIIRATTVSGDIVVDPFCGSGSTIEAAIGLKRQGWGIDLKQENVDLSLEGARQAVLLPEACKRREGMRSRPVRGSERPRSMR